MQFSSVLIKATLAKRYKRFFADAILNNGTTVTAHCPNTGSMKGLSEPGSTIWLSTSNNPKRKLKYTWELYQTESSGNLVGVNASRANTIVHEAIQLGIIPDLAGYGSVRREVLYGKQSRIDFLLEDQTIGKCFVEVKNVHFSPKTGLAKFPDSITIRGKKHLNELSNVKKTGARALTIYVIQREDCDRFSLACDIDPDYCEAFHTAKKAGVEFICYSCKVMVDSISLSKLVSFDVYNFS